MTEKRLSLSATLSENVTDKLEDISDSVNEAIGSFEALDGAAESLESSMEGVSESIDDTGNELQQVNRDAQQATASLAELQGVAESVGTDIEFGVDFRESDILAETAKVHAMAKAFGPITIPVNIDADRAELAGLLVMSDKVEDFADTLNTLRDSMPAGGSPGGGGGLFGGDDGEKIASIAADLGPLNLRLSNLKTTLVTIAGLGGIAGALGGLATAGLTGLGGGLLATLGGAQAKAQELADTMESVKNRSEGMEVVMSSVKSLIDEAIAPLRNAETAALFEDVVEGAAHFVNLVSQGVAAMVEMENAFDLGDFLGGLGNSVLSNLPSIMDALATSLNTLGPDIVAIFDYLLSSIPGVVRAMTDMAANMRGMAPLVDSIFRAIGGISELGGNILTGLAPALNVVLELFNGVLSVINAVPDGLIQLATFAGVVYFAFSNLSAVGAGLAGTLSGLAGTATGLAGSLTLDAFTAQGLAASLRSVTASAWGSVTALASTAAGALSSAAGFVTATVSAISFGTALNVALAGIPALLGAVVAGGALLVGVLGNMDGITSALSGTFDALSGAVSAIGNLLLDVFVPTWNIVTGILVTAWRFFSALPAPIQAIVSPITLVDDALRLLGQGLNWVMKKFGQFGNIAGSIMDSIGKGFLNTVNNVVIPAVNEIIKAYNKIPGVGNIDTIGDFEFGQGNNPLAVSRGDLAGQTKDANVSNQMTKQPKPEINYNVDEGDNNVTIEDARPEDTQRLKRLVKDSMEEANTFRRKKDAYSG